LRVAGGFGARLLLAVGFGFGDRVVVPGLLVAAGAGFLVSACSGGYDTPRPSAAIGRPASVSHPGSRPERSQSFAGGYKVGAPYRIGSQWYVPHEDPSYDRAGTASWYGADFHGRATANGEIYNMDALTAAHPTLPLPSYVTVTNQANGRTILVRVNDRGPYIGGRLIDLSRAAARVLGYEHMGTASVRVRYAGRAPLNGDTSRERAYLAAQPWYRPEVAQASGVASRAWATRWSLGVLNSGW